MAQTICSRFARVSSVCNDVFTEPFSTDALIGHAGQMLPAAFKFQAQLTTCRYVVLSIPMGRLLRHCSSSASHGTVLCARLYSLGIGYDVCRKKYTGLYDLNSAQRLEYSAL